MTDSGLPSFAVRVLVRAGDVAVVVRGDVDLDTASSLRETLLRAIEDDPAVVTVDLAGVDYFDSTGVQVLYEALEAARSASKTLRIQRPKRHVLHVLQVTGLTELVDVDVDADAGPT